MSNDAYLILTYFAALSASILVAAYIYVSLQDSFSALLSELLQRTSARRLGSMFSSSIWLVAILGFSSISMMSSCAGIHDYADVVVDKVYVYGKARTQISAAATYLYAGLLLWGVVVSVLVVGNKKRGKQPHKAGE